jgi:hypothetical protein
MDSIRLVLAIAASCRWEVHHINYIHEMICDRVISLYYFPTEQHVADIFTKSFIENKFSELRAMLGVVETTE